MVETELLVAVVSVIFNAIMTLVVGYLVWHLKRRAKKKQEYRSETDELTGIIKGIGESETELTEGLLHLVERHDEELDHAASERAEMRRRIQELERKSKKRTASDADNDLWDISGRRTGDEDSR